MWPKADARLVDEKATAEMYLVMEVISAIRNVRGEMRINPAQKIKALIKVTGGQKLILEENMGYLSSLARLESLSLAEDMAKPAGAAAAVVAGIEIYIPLADIIDLGKEKERLEKEIAKAAEEVARVNIKLTNKEFMHKAPISEVDRVKEKAREITERIHKLEENLKSIS
jgi:valyl-tRNA synthetase